MYENRSFYLILLLLPRHKLNLRSYIFISPQPVSQAAKGCYSWKSSQNSVSFLQSYSYIYVSKFGGRGCPADVKGLIITQESCTELLASGIAMVLPQVSYLFSKLALII